MSMILEMTTKLNMKFSHYVEVSIMCNTFLKLFVGSKQHKLLPTRISLSLFVKPELILLVDCDFVGKLVFDAGFFIEFFIWL